MTAQKLTVNEYDPPRGPRAEPEIETIAPPSEADADRRRAHGRYSVDLDVSLGSDHNFYAGLAENISSGGVFVATHMLKPVGDTVELSIHVAESDRVIQAEGEVRWIRDYNESNDVPPGMGIRWTSLAEDDAEFITQFSTLRPPLLFDDDD